MLLHLIWIVNTLRAAANNGWYLPYPPDDGIPIAPVENPTNHIPYYDAFLQHCCTFAHELLTDFKPHASRLRQTNSWNVAPDISLDVDSIEKNRVGMRYYRGVLGYFYDKIVRFASLPPNSADRSAFEADWHNELQEMQDLDYHVCRECQDNAGGSRLRDFIHFCNVSEWDTAFSTVETLTVGGRPSYKCRLPKIDRSNPNDLRPHATANVRDWISNVPFVDSGWQSMMRSFDDCVIRYDRDPGVRMLSGLHNV